MKKLTLLFAAMLMCATAVFGQGKTISGTVIEAPDMPVIGAAVQVKGAESVGTVTDFDGKFTIELPAGSKILVVSFMGLQTQEVEAKDGMVVTLGTDAAEIEEVMVVAYGATTKKSFTGSATVVRGETLEKKNPSEVSKALAGEIAGVQVVSSSGQPGTSATIVVRGMGSVNTSTTPLYVVDGIPYDGDISSIDPSDIASTTILKDATATSLYGSRGSNGVILITTKKGTSGESGRIDVDFKYGANMRLIPMYDVVDDPQQYVEMAWQGMYNYNFSGDAEKAAQVASGMLFGDAGIPSQYNMWQEAGNALINPSTGKFYTDKLNRPTLRPGWNADPYTTWEDNIFRVGQKMEGTVKIHGGSDKTTYYTSFGYLKDEGYYIGSDYSRFTARANVDHQAKKWLKGNMNMSYAYSQFNNPGQGSNMNNGFAYVNGIPAIYPVFLRDADGYIQKETANGLTGNAYDYGEYRLFGFGINPAGALQLDKSNVLTHQFTGNATLEASICKGLKATANFGVQYISTASAELTNPFYGDAAGVGRVDKSHNDYLSFTMNQLLTYSNTFADDHSLSAFVAHESLINISRSMYGGMNYVARPDGLEWGNAIEMSYMGSGTSQYSIESYFASLSYNYKGKYFVNGNYRADGSSRFAKGNKWGNFGSVGLAWLLTGEDFMSSVNVLRNFKIKASWGVLGNQNIGLYLFTDQYSIGNVNNEIAYNWNYFGNPDLTWEKSNNFNAGVEFGLGKVLTAEIDYYYRVTSNMLFSRPVAPSLGYGSRYVNEGRLMNQGIEFQFNIAAVDTRNFKLNVRLNGSHNTNKMLEMPKEANGDYMIMSGSMAKGKSIGEYFMSEYMGVDPATGQALYKKYYDALSSDKDIYGDPAAITNVYLYQYSRDEEGTPYEIRDTVTTRADQAGFNYVNKSYLPDLQGGFGVDMSFFGVDVSASFMYTIGGYGMDYTYMQLMHSDRAGEYNWHQDMVNAAKPTVGNDGNIVYTTHTDVVNDQIPRLSNGKDYYANSSSTRFLTSNTNLTLSNVRVGYSFPKKWLEKIKLNNLNLWVSADNLFCLSARKGYIPISSFSGSSSSYQYTPLSTILGGIKIQF